jgi:hypothetical protein
LRFNCRFGILENRRFRIYKYILNKLRWLTLREERKSFLFFAGIEIKGF